MSDDLVERLYDRRVCSPAQNSCCNDWMLDQAAERIEELEAKLAKAVETLEFYAHVADYPFASRTLAELKGETNE